MPPHVGSSVPALGGAFPSSPFPAGAPAVNSGLHQHNSAHRSPQKTGGLGSTHHNPNGSATNNIASEHRHRGAGGSEKAAMPNSAVTAHDPPRAEHGIHNDTPAGWHRHTASGSPAGNPLPATSEIGNRHYLHVPTTAERLRSGSLEHLVNTNIGRQVDLRRQFELHHHGDVARQLNLSHQLALHGGWNHRFSGPVSANYTQHASGHAYAGPGFYRQRCWYPHWSPWVNWSWNFNCRSIYDPRPLFCRPYFYRPCSPWSGWYYPGWAGLPYGTSGTWVNVPTVAVVGVDLQLLAVRFVDPGHPEQQLGPRYRVWFRNNSAIAIDQAFDLLLLATNDQNPVPGVPEAGVRVTAIDAGQIEAVDVRLPYEANVLDADARGNRVPFRFLHVLVDAQRELPDADVNNNGAVLDRLDIMPIDPTVFSATLEESDGVPLIDIAGEGLGPEPGQVVIRLGKTEVTPEITGWYDLGIQVRMPSLKLLDLASAEILVIRGDKAASNPLRLTMPAPAEVIPQPVP